MATNSTPTTEETLTTVPERPPCIADDATWLGRDDAGREHYATGPLPWGTVLVTDGEEIVERLDLPVQETTTDTVIETRPDWMAYVSDRCGWDVRADDASLTEMLAGSAEGDA
jgi:hypothetical protein